MNNRNVTGILKKIQDETGSLFGEHCSDFRFMFGGYLISDPTRVVGESLNIMSTADFRKVATVNVSYGDDSVISEVCLYPSKYVIPLRHIFKAVLAEEKVAYREVCEHV